MQCVMYKKWRTTAITVVKHHESCNHGLKVQYNRTGCGHVEGEDVRQTNRIWWLPQLMTGGLLGQQENWTESPLCGGVGGRALGLLLHTTEAPYLHAPHDLARVASSQSELCNKKWQAPSPVGGQTGTSALLQVGSCSRGNVASHWTIPWQKMTWTVLQTLEILVLLLSFYVQNILHTT